MCKAIRGVPAMCITFDFNIYLYLDAAQHPEKLELEPMELCGFNTGDVSEHTWTDESGICLVFMYVAIGAESKLQHTMPIPCTPKARVATTKAPTRQTLTINFQMFLDAEACQRCTA